MASLESFIEAIKHKPTFPASAYTDRLQQACQASNAVAAIKSNLPVIPNTSDSSTFDGQDCTPLLQSLAVATCARGLSQVNDAYGFNSTVDVNACIRQAMSSITSFVPFAMADDIDAILNTAKLPNLNTLKLDRDFVQSYNEELMKPAFIRTVRDRDLAASSHEYGMILLFIHQFFATGGKYEMLQSLPDTGGNSSITQVAHSWVTSLAGTSNAIGLEKAAEESQNLLWISKCISSVYSQNGMPNVSLRDNVETVAGSLKQPVTENLQNAIKAIMADPGAASFYNGLGPYIWAIWDNRTGAYTQSMVNAVNQITSWSEQVDEPHQMCHGGPSAGCVTIHDYHTIAHTRYGDILSSWCNGQKNANSACFRSGPPSDEARTRVTDNGAPPTCFAPGTLVLTDSGSKPIEKLRENDVVVTSTADRTFGYCSDEKVVHATHQKRADTLLFGFNEEKPFFTAGHVFYTTTGLRAVSPVVAIKENPWLNVGKLCVGHKVLRADKLGDEYEAVDIKTLHSERATCDAVYGVHLREGARSYHANGYLVRMNYPEITIAAIAKNIRALPRPVQVSILASLKDIAPLLRRFGADTILEALDRETKYNRSMTTKKCRPKSHINLQHINRTWYLHAVDRDGHAIETGDSKLPKVSLTDGILHLDGQYCEQAAVVNHTVRWTRPLPGSHEWEHGTCLMSDHGFAGQGYLYVSDERDPLEPPSIRNRVRFVASLPRQEHVHSLVRAHHMLSHQGNPLSTSDDDAETFSCVYGKKAALATIRGEDTKLFDIISTSTTMKSAGIILPDVQIPVLDRLQSLLQHQLREYLKLADDKNSIIRLYEVASALNDDNETITTVTLLYPDLVYRSSDDYALGEKAAKTYKDLTYRNIGSAETLSLLFSSFSFNFNWDGTQIQGSIIHYDPVKPGTEGEEFGLAGTMQDSTFAGPKARLAATQAARQSYVNMKDGHDARKTGRKPFHRHSEPAKVTSAMSESDPTCAPMSAQSLAELSPWSDADVHALSQTLLYQTMLYHIDDSYRESFFNEKKPDNLDPQLTTGLSKDAADWIKNTYGPAYICNRLDSVDDVTKFKWQRSFTSDEQKKLRWFWVGKGKNSIYCSPQYNTLNEVTATVAVRSLHPCLQQYIDDTVPDNQGNIGGKKWSNALYKSMSTPVSIRHLVDNFRIGSGSSLLSKHCNVMHALDADKTNANSLAEKVRRKLETDVSNMQPNTPTDNDAAANQDEYMWCYDAMKKLILAVLNNDPAINSDIKKSLSKDINDLMEQWGINAGEANDEKAEKLLSNGQSMVEQMATLLRSMRLATPNATWVGMKGWAKSTAVGGLAAKVATNPKVGAAFKGLMILAGVANFLFTAIGSFRRWDELTKEERAALIINTLAAVCNVAGGAIELWEMIKEMRQNPTIDEEIKEQTIGNILDDEQRIDIVTSDEDVTSGYEPIPDEADAFVDEFLKDAVIVDKFPNAELDPMVEATKEQAEEVAKVAKNFNTAGTWVRGALIVLGAAATIVMIVQIAMNWDKLDIMDRFLTVAQILQQGLAVIVDVVGLVTEGLFAFGEIAEATLIMVSTCLAWAGAVLAVIGFVLMIALMIWDNTKEPPLTPVEQWIQDHGKPFLDSLDAPPNPQLAYSAPASIKNGEVLTFTATNRTSKDVTVAQITVYFQTGDDPSTLTTEEDYVIWKPDTNFKPPNVRIQPSDQYVVAVDPNVSQKNAAGKNIIRESVIASGIHDKDKNPHMNVTIKAGGKMDIQVLGTISAAGLSTVEIQETSVDAVPVSTFFQITKQ